MWMQVIVSIEKQDDVLNAISHALGKETNPIVGRRNNNPGTAYIIYDDVDPKNEEIVTCAALNSGASGFLLDDWFIRDLWKK